MNIVTIAAPSNTTDHAISSTYFPPPVLHQRFISVLKSLNLFSAA
ncbi:MAG: hypothetical protein SOV85_04950 [Clostridium sp.]|nr:hypothetical protein [Clostridium sp.]MDY2630686.1 hypothetical protein [Clostridium sp.]